MRTIKYIFTREYCTTRSADHFFRGKLQISLPDAGVYGFLDKSTQAVMKSHLNTCYT